MRSGQSGVHGRDYRQWLSASLIGLLGCVSASVPSGRQQSVATPAWQADTGAVYEAVAAHIAIDAPSYWLVVRGSILPPDSPTPLESQKGYPVEIAPNVVRFAVAAGALIEPWWGPDSPWEREFLSASAGSVRRLSLFDPHIGEREAWLDVSEVVLRPGARPPRTDPEVWQYRLVRTDAGAPWRFVRRELVRAY